MFQCEPFLTIDAILIGFKFVVEKPSWSGPGTLLSGLVYILRSVASSRRRGAVSLVVMMTQTNYPKQKGRIVNEPQPNTGYCIIVCTFSFGKILFGCVING